MRFKDREEAGKMLAESLSGWKGRPGVVVAALPRGGIVLGRIVADALDAPLDVIVPRKIGAPSNPEYAIGAVAEGGEAVWNEEERAAADPRYLEAEVAAQHAEAARRLKAYRAGLPLRDLKGKSVIIVDDGVATGLTMRAAIRTAKSEGASRIIVAVPVSAPDSLESLKAEADEVVALHVPDFFGAVGTFYDAFTQVDDGEVVELLQKV